MEVFTVNLYNEFNLTAPENASGTLTAYLPERSEPISLNRKRPAMLIIPGGGYAFVSEREAEPVAFKFLAKGYACFVLNYSVTPVKYPWSHREAAMAVSYIRKNAQKFGINSVNGIGFSAGGHLLGCMATLYDSPALDVLGEYKALCKLDNAVFVYPVITYGNKGHLGSFESLCGDDIELRKSLSIEKNVDKNSVPCYIVHTMGDTVVPVKNSLLLASAYEEFGVPFSLHIFEKGNHGMSVNDITCDREANLLDRKDGATVDYSSWVEESLIWLSERGVKVED